MSFLIISVLDWENENAPEKPGRFDILEGCYPGLCPIRQETLHRSVSSFCS
jgi:hypothetical protein